LANGIPTGPEADWIKLDGADRTTFLVAKMGTQSGLIFKSLDAGNSWTQLPGTHNPASYNTWTNMVAVSPSNQDVIFSGSIGCSRSTDGGATFSPIRSTHADHHQIVFSPTDSSILYMATDGGVYRSNDNGATWILSSTNLTATQFYSLGVAQTSPLLIGGATQDQGIIRTSGTSAWTDTGAGNEGGFFIVDPNNSNNVYVTPWGSNLRRSTDGAVTWTTILNGLGTPAPGVRHLTVMPGDPTGLLCAAGADVFRSDDQGNDWGRVFTPSGTPRQVAYAPSNAAIAYTATSEGRVYRNGRYGAADSWAEPYAAADRPPIGSVNALIVGWNDPDYVAIGYGGTYGPKVYVSEDGGMHWRNAGGVLDTDAIPNVPIMSLVLHPYQPETIYAATTIGVFYSRDGGDSWERFDDGMPRSVTTQLVLRRSSLSLYASTMGRGVYQRAL
jgi:photosystem II stability/assembly factor-like uncharacterized protein